MTRSERISAFVAEIWQWYANHKRDLPWRDLWYLPEEDRAYRVLVSEVMLQQTQVERVKIVFKRFIEQFPKIEDLAAASNRDILIAWRGMGYNARALRLRDCARVIGNRESGIVRSGFFPKEMNELMSLPGLGHYTAAAIRNFAFNIPTPCLDTNIRRILHRTFVGPENADGTFEKDDQYLLKLAENILNVAISECDSRFPIPESPFGAASWHAALMDFGSLIQTKTNPKWHLCPLTRRGIMKATKSRFPDSRPHACPPKLQRRGDSPITRQEPGRFVGSRYIPNRIFRGKIIEELRDEESGLPLHEIGRRICIDWSPQHHRLWLQKLTEKLVGESLLMKTGDRYFLAE